MSGEAVLQVRGLSVDFLTARGRLHALDSVDLDVRQGTTLAVVGESGSGKSVLSRTILRLLPPTARVAPGARILFDGEDLLALDRAAIRSVRGRRIAMVFQDPMTALNPVRTIGSQLAEGLRLHLGMKPAAAASRAVELLATVGIASPAQRARQYPHQLSGGMRQRVVIAMAIACEPELLIADEPTTALDVTVQADILDLLSRLQAERRMTMILITHDLGIAAGRADEIAVMYAGRLVEKASTREVFRRPRMPYTAALLRSIPKLDDPPHARLFAIPGRPPVVFGDTAGCRYAPRCDRADAACAERTPPLVADGQGHGHRCWHPLEGA
ncbi:MAG: ABC transporter ATP-binding protein [Burkholderiaceae bacterium]|nr:ABC transporter ATP-binding protein [Burkholderiaceae bacterium]